MQRKMTLVLFPHKVVAEIDVTKAHALHSDGHGVRFADDVIAFAKGLNGVMSF